MSSHSPGESLELRCGAGREVPIRVYQPSTARAAVVFSVGFGGTRDSYAYLARHWCEHDLLVVVTEHLGSNLEVLKELNRQGREQRHQRLWQLVRDPAEFAARVADLRAATDFVEQRWPQLAVAVGGHSYGSATALASAGVPVVLQGEPSNFLDSRYRGCLSISPQPAGIVFAEEAYRQVSVPVFLLTGTEDGELPQGMLPADRARVFELLPRGYLGILEGATHMAFANQGLGVGRFLEPIRRLTTSFWRTVFFDEEWQQEQAHRESQPVGLQWRQS